jgi:diguanylate cyclase (GGDEF)-like protein
VSLLSSLDVRTILACQLSISAAFTVVFFAMMWAYRQFHGIGSIATGFLLCAPGVVLISLRGSISDFASIVLANALILCAYLYFYLGILRFFAGVRRPQPIGIWSATGSVVLAVPVIAWFAAENPNPAVRILVISLVSAFICTLISIELFRQAASRLTLKLFACFILLPAASSLYRAAHTLRFGASTDLMQGDASHVFVLILDLVFICAMGVFFQLMIASELTHTIEDRARHDLLTRTLNRTGIEARLSIELDRAHRKGHPLSAVLIDVDHFKTINDDHGHAAGDQALRSVAECIANSLRSYDLLGRYGGDEFLLLLPETRSREALEVADRIRVLIGTSPQVPGWDLLPTVSIGITELLPLDTALSFLARADAALYDAKHAGRNCVRRRSSSGVHPIAKPSFESSDHHTIRR